MFDYSDNVTKIRGRPVRSPLRNSKLTKSHKQESSRQPNAASYSDRIKYLGVIAKNIIIKRTIIVFCISFLFFLVAVFYALVAPTQYESTTYIYLDPRGAQIDGPRQANGDFAMAANLVQSQVDIIGSERIAKSVLFRLGPSWAGTSVPTVTQFGRLFGREPLEKDWNPEKIRLAIRSLHARLIVKREPMTFIISISYRSPDPPIAQQVSQAVADAYIADLLDSAKQSNKLASGWLKESLEGLRQQAQMADRAVQDFRTKTASADPVILNDLESRSQVARITYESFLKRFIDLVQQQSFPMTDARIASEASTPEAVGLGKLYLLTIATLFGTLIGFFISFLLEVERQKQKPELANAV
jgi:uncharacterized protein involved in exopolysaccharide biosynthesis